MLYGHPVDRVYRYVRRTVCKCALLASLLRGEGLPFSLSGKRRNPRKGEKRGGFKPVLSLFLPVLTCFEGV